MARGCFAVPEKVRTHCEVLGRIQEHYLTIGTSHTGALAKGSQSLCVFDKERCKLPPLQRILRFRHGSQALIVLVRRLVALTGVLESFCSRFWYAAASQVWNIVSLLRTIGTVVLINVGGTAVLGLGRNDCSFHVRRRNCGWKFLNRRYTNIVFDYATR